MDCIIKEHYVVGDVVSPASIHIAQQEGTRIPATPRSVRYRNTQTKEDYLCLAGGFGWPGTKPGSAIIVGLQESGDKDRPLIVTLEELEETDVRALLRKAYDLYEKYGLNCKELPFMWYGDADNGLNTFMYNFNGQLRREKRKPFFLSPPPHFDKPNRFEIYCRTIYSHLQTTEKGLVIGQCAKLRSHLTTLNMEMIHKGTVDDYPAISALGYVLCALFEYKTWMVNLNIPAMKQSDPWLEPDPYDPFNVATMGKLIRGVE